MKLNSYGTIFLYSERCLLRRFEYNDYLDVFSSYLSDKNVSKYLASDPHKNILETRYLLNEFIKNYNNLNYYNWIIINKYNNDVIGTVSLHEIDLNNDKVEIGIIISSNYQNKGYAKEVLNRVINFAFFDLNVHRIEAKVMINNYNSNKTFKSLGFIYEGTIHSCVKKNLKYYDVNLYCLINPNN